MDKHYDIVDVILPGGTKCKAILVNEVYLAHPQLNQNSLTAPYEKAIVLALETAAGSEAVRKAAKNAQHQLLLPIGKHWFAPMSIHKTDGRLIALLHYGPA
ncbi:MAG: hypothetical protein UV87_C0004G0003 [candidate division WWE3 bacterium GW2011_GWD1_43_201]|nr:MAG: hypothetical protein UV87_C0004G0003 [candidate division WWE3 bacterium GW2011_GWD1_43_201]